MRAQIQISPESLHVAPLVTDNAIPIKTFDTFFDPEPDKVSGLYLTRPAEVSVNHLYCGTIGTDKLISNFSGTGIKPNFYPEFKALICKNDEWSELPSNGNEDFYVLKNDPSNYSVTWYLHENAPAALYGVRCVYEEASDDGLETTVNVDFRILYTENWTYIDVVNDNGDRRITNYVGGERSTLYLNVTFNDGAAAPDLAETTDKLSTGVGKGELSSGDIVNTKDMQVSVKTVSGKVYDDGSLMTDIDTNKKNRVALRFLQPLGDDIYIVQFKSNADNRIIGQFVIDNSSMQGGVNLSHLWVVVMALGGVLALGASLAFLVPLLVVKVNEVRVAKENDRIARMKNPEAYATKKKGSFSQALKKLIYNLKTPVYKRKKETENTEQAATEVKQPTNRFTEMLEKRQEKRNYMREHNVTSEEMERIKATEAAAALDQAKSFASLRDDDGDDEIATFHAAKDEISTLETGSYVQDGTTFAQLDSMRDNEQVPNNPTNNGSNPHDENNGN